MLISYITIALFFCTECQCCFTITVALRLLNVPALCNNIEYVSIRAVIFNKHIKSARYSLIEVYATILTVQECRCDARHIYEFFLQVDVTVMNALYSCLR